MAKFFAEDNPFNAALTKIFDLCILNVCALICSIPVVTAGASMTALYAVMLPMTENKEGPIIKSFLKQFRANLKGSVKTWLFMLLAALVLMFDLYVWTKTESQYRSVFFGLTIAMLAALAVVASWYFGLRATFEDTGKMSLINAGKYALIYLPASILMGAYTAGLVYVYLQQGYIALFVPIFGVTLIEYPKAWYMRQKFNAYIEDHSDIYNVSKDEEEQEEADRAPDGEAVEENAIDTMKQAADNQKKTGDQIDEGREKPEDSPAEREDDEGEKAHEERDEVEEKPEDSPIESEDDEAENVRSEIDEEEERPESSQAESKGDGAEEAHSEDEEKTGSVERKREEAENKKAVQGKPDKTQNGEKKTVAGKNNAAKKNKNSSKGNRNKKKRKKKK